MYLDERTNTEFEEFKQSGGCKEEDFADFLVGDNQDQDLEI